MENRLTRCLYDNSPVFFQNLFTSCYGLQKRLSRYGRHFRQYRDFFQRSLKWPRADLEAFQSEKVRFLVKYCYEHVPFYRSVLTNNNLHPDDIRNVSDLPKLPVLEKTDLRGAGKSLLSDAVSPRRIRCATTSGSSGYPITNYWTDEAEQREYGFTWARRMHGIQFGESYGSFTGLQIVRANSLRPPFWRQNYAANQTCYSIFHMTPQTMPLYIEEILRHKHSYLAGYPSAIAQLGRCIHEHNLPRPTSVKAIFVSSEQLLPEYKHWISTGFGVPVYDQYGQNEKVASVTEYECGHMHYDMDYSVMEFVPAGLSDSGAPVYDIICTGFDNLAAPLIRYRVGDLVELEPNPPVCDYHAGPIIKCIHGRTSHALVASDGRRIFNISVIAKRCNNISGMQCVQKTPGEVEIRIIPEKEYSHADEVNILHQFRAKMGQMNFRIVCVEKLELTASGKLLSIISRIRS